MVIITRKEVLKLNVNISFKLKDAGNFKTQNNIWETGNTNDKKKLIDLVQRYRLSKKIKFGIQLL